MCEDRSLSIKRGSTRDSRIRSIRMRMRQNALLMRRFGERPPSPDPILVGSSSADPSSVPPPRPATGDSEPERASAAARIAANPQVYLPHRPLCQGLCCEAERRRRREGLLDIALRTVILMRNNRELQRRLHALQAETRDYIKAIMVNRQNNQTQDPNKTTPENQSEERHDEA